MTPLRALVFLCSSLMACHSHVVPSLSFPFFSSFYSSSQAPLHNSVTSTSSSTSSGPNSDTRELIESSQGDPSAPQQAEPEPDWGHMIRVAAGGGDLHRVRELHELGGSRVEHLNDEDGNGWQVLPPTLYAAALSVVVCSSLTSSLTLLLTRTFTYSPPASFCLHIHVLYILSPALFHFIVLTHIIILHDDSTIIAREGHPRSGSQRKGGGGGVPVQPRSRHWPPHEGGGVCAVLGQDIQV